MGRLLPFVALAIIVYVICTREPEKTKHAPVLDPLATASLVPGKGLGDLVLGETTLGEVAQRYGIEKSASVHGDHSGIELVYASTQLRLQFQLSNKIANSLQPPLHKMHRDPEAYIFSHPPVRDLELHSLSVRGPRHERTAEFYAGSLGGLRLGADETQVLKWAGATTLDELRGIPGVLHAGVSKDEPSITLWLRKRGVILGMQRENVSENETRTLLRRITLLRPPVTNASK